MAAPQTGWALKATDGARRSGRRAEIAALTGGFDRFSAFAPSARGAGLSRGESAITTAAVGRLVGCPTTVELAARIASDSLRRHREVQVLIEEGLPSPLTGRLGAIVSAAGTLSRSPPLLSAREIWRLEEAALDDAEIVDLILTTAVANWTTRITLGLPADLSPKENRS